MRGTRLHPDGASWNLRKIEEAEGFFFYKKGWEHFRNCPTNYQGLFLQYTDFFNREQRYHTFTAEFHVRLRSVKIFKRSSEPYDSNFKRLRITMKN